MARLLRFDIGILCAANGGVAFGGAVAPASQKFVGTGHCVALKNCAVLVGARAPALPCKQPGPQHAWHAATPQSFPASYPYRTHQTNQTNPSYSSVMLYSVCV